MLQYMCIHIEKYKKRDDEIEWEWGKNEQYQIQRSKWKKKKICERLKKKINNNNNKWNKIKYVWETVKINSYI